MNDVMKPMSEINKDDSVLLVTEDKHGNRCIFDAHYSDGAASPYAEWPAHDRGWYYLSIEAGYNALVPGKHVGWFPRPATRVATALDVLVNKQTMADIESWAKQGEPYTPISCKECKFFDQEPVSKYADIYGPDFDEYTPHPDQTVGICRLALHSSVAAKEEDGHTSAHMEAGFTGPMAVKDASDFSAALWVKETHGCRAGVHKENPSKEPPCPSSTTPPATPS